LDNQPIDFSGNVERFSGFADLYDKYRPAPPSVLASVLTQIAQKSFPKLVVDLGSGTGLSTRYWADKAEKVIGIEPTLDMRRQAEVQTEAKNVSYQERYSHQTNLPEHCAQIVTCSQSLHWMEPQSTFREAARILVPGGVFAAYDYDWPPTTSDWQAEQAYRECTTKVAAIEKTFENKKPPLRWEKHTHLSRMQDSGDFRFTKEIVVHHTEQGNAERLIGLLLSQGSVMTLLKSGLSEKDLGIDVFKRRVTDALGDENKTWYWSSRIRYGIV
jgi:ubiquinone/menaquinone biosynthesis C-methylase UbiE